MKRLIFDLDDTITLGAPLGYERAIPNAGLIERMREYKSKGFEIAISTSRNVRTFQGNVGRINAVTLPLIVEWLDAHQVPYDEIYTGKPWCGEDGFYIDDKAVRPDEFLEKSYEELVALTRKGTT